MKRVAMTTEPETCKPYRYEATINLVIYADGQDAAWQAAKSAADGVNAAALDRLPSDRAAITEARTSMTALRYMSAR